MYSSIRHVCTHAVPKSSSDHKSRPHYGWGCDADRDEKACSNRAYDLTGQHNRKLGVVISALIAWICARYTRILSCFCCQPARQNSRDYLRGCQCEKTNTAVHNRYPLDCLEKERKVVQLLHCRSAARDVKCDDTRHTMLLDIEMKNSDKAPYVTVRWHNSRRGIVALLASHHCQMQNARNRRLNPLSSPTILLESQV